MQAVFEELSKAVASADEIELQSDGTVALCCVPALLSCSAVAKRARKQLQKVKDLRKCRQDLIAGVEEVRSRPFARYVLMLALLG